MFHSSSTISNDQVQGRLFSLAALFLVLYAMALSLSPAARLRTWEVSYLWDHWLAVLLWMALFSLVHRYSTRWLPERDPYLLPCAALLCGWGILTIWRLYPGFGARQSLWLMVTLAFFMAGLRLPEILSFLRRYKYVWLTGGLLLTGLTLLFGTNPMGEIFPRLWLGCCGIFLQPSEPLKLLLIVYLAAYLADHWILNVPFRKVKLADSAGGRVRNLFATPLLPLLAPTLVMAGLALLLLVAQRDLGTASIFLFLYTVIIYVGSGRKQILAAGLLALVLAGSVGYALFDVVRVRMDAWLNPWLDPSGRSYQIVQSLLAIANGGLVGRGPGSGSPGLVPVPHSDFIFAAIAEETGMVGTLGLLLVIALVASRGVRIALRASDSYRRYLAAGLTAYLVGQSILIIGGNLRLMPLTGVTLPFVSYGGSSLLTSFISLLILLHISNQTEARPAALFEPRPYLQLHAFLLAGLAAAALTLGWWSIYRAPVLLGRTDNPRRTIADRYVQRGAILDRNNIPLSTSGGQIGEYFRQTHYPLLSTVLGYTSPVYGQSGLEESLDIYLRGLRGYPSPTLWWEQLRYGQPPPGLDVRLNLDLNLQQVADEQLGERAGAAVLLNSQNGEILVMASHPSFDANRLDQTWNELINDPRAPLLNRAAQGLYSPGAALGPFLLAAAQAEGDVPALPERLDYRLDGRAISCALELAVEDWAGAVANGCPGAVAVLGEALGGASLERIYQALGLYTTPQLRIAAGSWSPPQVPVEPALAALGAQLRISPLQMALAAASLSGNGTRPAPQLVSAINSPISGWMLMPALEQPVQAIPMGAANTTANALVVAGQPFWQSTAIASNGPGQIVTWYLAGTLANWEGIPLSVAVVLEEAQPELAAQLGQTILRAALEP